LYRVPKPRRSPQRRPVSDPVEQAIVEVAEANQTDGYRMVAAFVRRRLGVPVNRKRVLRVMRERKLIQRRRPLERRKRPGFFQVERPRQLWQLDMTSVWVAEHWCYQRDRRLLHPPDRRLVTGVALSRRRGDPRSSSKRSPPTGSRRASSCSGATTGRPSPPAASAPASPSSASATAAAATMSVRHGTSSRSNAS
jgi:transposase InsO family protein